MDIRCAGLARLRPGALLLAIVIVGLAACGGGSDSPSTAPDGSPRFDATYLGYGPGDQRLYRLTDGTGFDSEVVQRALAVRGVPAVELFDSIGTASYLAVNDRGLDVLPAESDNGVRSLFGAVPVLRFGRVPSGPNVLYDVSKEITFSSPRGVSVETRALYVRGWVKGFEDVTTPLGTFTQAARVRTEYTSTATADGNASVSKVVTEEWYAKGVGVVRRELQTTATGSPSVNATYELVAYRVAGRANDETAPALVSAVMAPSVMQPLPPPDYGVTAFQTTTFAFDDWFMPLPVTSGEAKVRDAETGETFSGSLVVGDDLRSLRFTVRGSLPPDRPLILVLPEPIRDWAGNPMPSRELAFTRDTRGPQVASMTPRRSSGDVGAMTLFRVVFDEPVVATESTTVVIRGPDGAVAARLPMRTDAGALVATLTTALPGIGVVYDWTIEGTVLDVSGNAAQGSLPTEQFVTTIGRFSSAGPVVDWLQMSASSLVDLDADGLPDFVYWTALQTDPPLGRLGVRLGRSDGTFGPDTLLVDTIYPSWSSSTYFDLRVGDFDGDGRRDVALASGTVLSVYLQRASMVFDALPSLFLRARIAGVLPGTSGPDTLLVIREADQEETRMFDRLRLNVASGVWESFATIARDGAFRGRWSIGDIDGNGSLDLAWLLHTDDGRTELATAPLTADGFGAIVQRPLPGPIVDAFAGPGFGWLALGDLNGDAIVDLVQLQLLGTNRSPSVVTWLGAGSGQFGPARTVPVRRAGGDAFATEFDDGGASSERAAHLADVDGDGRDDMLFEVEWSASKLALLRQGVDGSFVSISPAPLTLDNPLRDLDGNGLVDAVGRNRIYMQSRGD